MNRMTSCTKCTEKPIAKEHLCEECYVEHNDWLKEDFSTEVLIDADGFYTVYESGGEKYGS